MEFILAIEDKVNYTERKDQLKKYRRTVQDYFGDLRPILVYLKTGDLRDGEDEDVDRAGWKYFGRGDLLKILEGGKQQGVKNVIFDDFHTRLRQMRAASAEKWRRRR